jgi:hypothetical protein
MADPRCYGFKGARGLGKDDLTPPPPLGVVLSAFEGRPILRKIELPAFIIRSTFASVTIRTLPIANIMAIWKAVTTYYFKWT